MPYTTTDQHESAMSASRVEVGAKNVSPLRGLKAICGYLGKSEKTVLKLINAEGLPAAKIGGGWESDTARLDVWRARQLAEKKNTQKNVFFP